MESVLIDTDIVLDLFFDREPFNQHAEIIFSLCENKELQGFVTPVIISNVYYLLRKVAKHEVVVGRLKSLLNIVSILQMDKDIIMNALNSNFKDFEDALQNFAAIDNGSVSIILTMNIKDFKNSKLAVFTPELYLKQKKTL